MIGDSVPRGDHSLPPSFSGGHSAEAPRSRRRRGLVLGAIAVVVLGVAFGATQFAANTGYDAAFEGFDQAGDTTDAAALETQEELDRLHAVTAAATSIIEQEPGPLVDGAGRDALGAAIADADAAADDAELTLDSEMPSAGQKPLWFWELFSASARLDADTAVIEGLGERLSDDAPELATAGESVADAGTALLSTTAAAAAPFEAMHVSATNDSVIALRRAAESAAAVSTLDDSAVAAFVALQGAAADVVATEQTELAEKAGPLRDARLKVEAFARSLAPGVLLEFDWSPTVNGAGGGGSMGGLTTWWWDSPGRAVIELSDSVAERWPSYSSKSLVAHEVGHAISVKCEDMYDSSTQDSIEKWATAWAISMGYTDDANGVWAYGYPPQSYIDAAAGCR